MDDGRACDCRGTYSGVLAPGGISGAFFYIALEGSGRRSGRVVGTHEGMGDSD